MHNLMSVLNLLENHLLGNNIILYLVRKNIHLLKSKNKLQVFLFKVQQS